MRRWQGLPGTPMHFNFYPGLEAAWVELGKVEYQNASIETSGLVLQGTGSLPIGPMFSILAKLGAIAWDQETRKAGTKITRV